MDHRDEKAKEQIIKAIQAFAPLPDDVAQEMGEASPLAIAGIWLEMAAQVYKELGGSYKTFFKVLAK